MAKVCGPVSGLVLNCQPLASLDLEMIWPSSPGLAVALTQAIQVMLPVVLSAVGLLRLTYAFVPLNERALPIFPLVLQVAPLRVPVMAFPEPSAVVVPIPSRNEYDAARALGMVLLTVTPTFDATVLFPAPSRARADRV